MTHTHTDRTQELSGYIQQYCCCCIVNTQVISVYDTAEK